MEKLIATYECTDAEGNRYTVHEYQEFVDATHMQSTGPEWIPGMKNYTLGNGQPVNVAGTAPLSFRLLNGTDLRVV